MTERKGQNEERRKKADGTIYDDVLRTIQERHGELLIPVVNDAFGMHYGKNEKVTRLPEEYQKVLSKVIADSCSMIGNHVYHMEVQSSEDGEMALRMVEYDFVIGLSMAEKSEEELVIPLPRSCVIYLRHTGRTPEAERICVRFQDGQTVRYLVPVIKMQEYTVDELFEKELYAYLPFYLMRYEKKLRKIEPNERYASELASECGRLLERLELALYDEPGTCQERLRQTGRVTEHLLYGRER